MKLTSDQVTEIERQLNAVPIPEEHPVITELASLFGEHTFYLSSGGVVLWEWVDEESEDDQKVIAVQVASWSDEERTSVHVHEPKPTTIVIDLAAETPPAPPAPPPAG